MNYSSKYIENAVNAFASLPGIGKKTALRLVLHLLKEDTAKAESFGDAIVRMRKEVKQCTRCCNISDTDVCIICSNPARNNGQICVVENLRDLMAIENTGIYNGLFHVLGGVISPIDGIRPEQLNIDKLVERVKSENIKEVIMALNPTMEGDTTIFYISRMLKDCRVQLSSIARGVAFGGELEYTDELTLARSITTRMPYEKYIVSK